MCRFSIRKYSFGVYSVALATLFVGGVATLSMDVEAEEIEASSNDPYYVVDGQKQTEAEMEAREDVTPVFNEDGTTSYERTTIISEEVFEEEEETETFKKEIDSDFLEVRTYIDENGYLVEEVWGKVISTTDSPYSLEGDTESLNLVNQFRWKTKYENGRMVWDNEDRDAQRRSYYVNTVWPAIRQDYIDRVQAAGGYVSENDSFRGTISSEYGVLRYWTVSARAYTGGLNVKEMVTQEEYQTYFQALEDEYRASTTYDERRSVIRRVNTLVSQTVYQDLWKKKFTQFIRDINEQFSENEFVLGVVFFDDTVSFSFDNPRNYAYEESVDPTISSVGTLVSCSWDDERGFYLSSEHEKVNNFFLPTVTVDVFAQGRNMTTLRNSVNAAFEDIRENFENDLMSRLQDFLMTYTDHTDSAFWDGFIEVGSSSPGEIPYLIDTYSYTGTYHVKTIEEEMKLISRRVINVEVFDPIVDPESPDGGHGDEEKPEEPEVVKDEIETKEVKNEEVKVSKGVQTSVSSLGGFYGFTVLISAVGSVLLRKKYR